MVEPNRDQERQGSGAGREGSFIRSRAWLGEGSHAGDGLKGRRCPDARIFEEVCERIAQHGQIDTSQIEVEVHDGEVTLSGTAPTRRMRHLAEDIAETVVGVQDIHNHLRVREAQQPMAGQARRN